MMSDKPYLTLRERPAYLKLKEKDGVLHVNVITESGEYTLHGVTDFNISASVVNTSNISQRNAATVRLESFLYTSEKKILEYPQGN